jgi:hypothetical protein
MKIKATQEQLEKALDVVNQKYQGNIQWNNFIKNGKGFNVTLKVKNSKEPGHSRGYYKSPGQGDYSTKRLSSACWHVHGNFFEALFKINPEATIISRGNKITKDFGNWEDFNVGSRMLPQYASEKCDCN